MRSQRHIEQPDEVNAGKERTDRGERLPEYPERRLFWCRSCGRRQESGRHVPRGWYTLSRHLGDDQRPLRLGVYCSAVCLAEQLPRLEGIEEELGGRWDVETARYRLR